VVWNGETSVSSLRIEQLYYAPSLGWDLLFMMIELSASLASYGKDHNVVSYSEQLILWALRVLDCRKSRIFSFWQSSVGKSKRYYNKSGNTSTTMWRQSTVQIDQRPMKFSTI
jgi:uncharacterized membrane protein